MWHKHNFFKYSVGTILCLLIIFLFGKIEYFINPLKLFVATLFFPFLISGMMYYILRPAVRWLVKIRIPRTFAIIVVIILSTAVVLIAGVYSGALIVSQFDDLKRDIPQIIELSRERLMAAANSRDLSFIPFDQLEEKIMSFSQGLIVTLPNNILNFVAALVNIATVLFLVPFILFYLLKDDHLFSEQLLKLAPYEHRKDGEEILEDIDKTLSSYIISQVIVGLIIGVLMYIGYLIIGLRYSFLLALFAAVTSIIPIVGAFLGVLPAVLVGLPGGTLVIVKILIIMAIVQQVQGNLISPMIMGKSMDIHPLTYIIIFLVSSALYGFVGMLIAVPVYAVLKVTLSNLYRIYRLTKISKSL
ncbi:MAG: AI-2E family transporter [Clostridia bacterium]|nr:AI-2E family transporter [Clostridia bacterium]